MRKPFGRLVGSTGAEQSLDKTSSKDKRAPLIPQTPGSKFFSPGEDLTHETINRALVALAENIEAVSSYLDMPEPEPVELQHNYDSMLGEADYGFAGLTKATNTNSFNLAELDSNSLVPPVWVYLGLNFNYVSNLLKITLDSSELDSHLYLNIGSVTSYYPDNYVFNIGSSNSNFNYLKKIPGIKYLDTSLDIFFK